MSLEQLEELEEELHADMVIEFGKTREEFDLILFLSATIFLLPVSIFGKVVFSGMTKRRFTFTLSDIIDLTLTVMVFSLWVVVLDYESLDLNEPLFGPEEDKQTAIRFAGNVIYDITNDIFHLDYLVAFVTAAFWFRCIILLRLTETFGPMLVMIWRMLTIVFSFLLIYILGLLTFASIATLTLHEIEVLADLFEAMRTYVMASLGNFDIYQYDVLEGWKKYFGIGMHVTVLFSNMILMLNLLIAIMSDTYAELAEVRTGLFWGSVIAEMPKIEYDDHYGVLSIFPFIFSWLSLLVMPFLVLIKDRKSLAGRPDCLASVRSVSTKAVVDSTLANELVLVSNFRTSFDSLEARRESKPF